MSENKTMRALGDSVGEVGLVDLEELVEEAGTSDRRLGKLMLKSLEASGLQLMRRKVDASAREGLGRLLRMVVVEGDEAPDIPMCVGIESSRRRFPCSGILWSRDVVLTAGHCEALGYREQVLAVPSIVAGAKRYRVKTSRRHPGFVGDPEYSNDLAVLFLEEPISGPVESPVIATEREVDQARAGVVVGYGSNETSGSSGFGVRRKADVSILWKRNSTPRKPSREPVKYDRKNELVAVPKSGRRDACVGDSGGPLLIATDEGLRLGAMVSRDAGMSYQPCGGGTIYLRLAPYKDWIEETIENYRAG